MADKTNRYAEEYLHAEVNKLPCKYCLRKWPANWILVDDMKAFMVLAILMGLTPFFFETIKIIFHGEDQYMNKRQNEKYLVITYASIEAWFHSGGKYTLQNIYIYEIYNPDKPNQYGIKAFKSCGLSNSFCSTSKLYTGAMHQGYPSNKGTTYDLVFWLMNSYFHCNRTL